MPMTGWRLSGVVLLCVLYTAAIAAAPRVQSQVAYEIAESWVDDNYDAVLRIILARATPKGPDPRVAEMRVTALIKPSGAEASSVEFYVVADRGFDRSVTVTCARLDVGLRKQMAEIVEALGDNATVEQVASRVKGETVSKRFLAKDAVGRHFERLVKQRIAAVPPGDWLVHADVYEVEISRASNEVRYTLFGSGDPLAKGEHPLIEWAKALRNLLAANRATR